MESPHVSILKQIALDYQELNGSHHASLQQLPTGIEFSRLVHISRPVLIDAPAVDIDFNAFGDDELSVLMGDQLVSIAITPQGNADAIVEHDDGQLYFVEPHTEKFTMSEFLSKLSDDSRKPKGDQDSVYYLQSQNGNLYRTVPDSGEQESSEFPLLRTRIPSEVDWASEAFGRPPDTVNLWIGNSRSVTSVHSDPYENIYTVIRGAKHFTLFPPSEGIFLKEKLFPKARYTREEDGRLRLHPSDASPSVRWSSVQDPSKPLPGAMAINITVAAGQTLYLPAGWWHYVRQSDDESGKCVAINWWYDMEMAGMNWVWLNFARGAL